MVYLESMQVNQVLLGHCCRICSNKTGIAPETIRRPQQKVEDESSLKSKVPSAVPIVVWLVLSTIVHRATSFTNYEAGKKKLVFITSLCE